MSEAVVFSEDAACVFVDAEVLFVDCGVLLLLHPEIKIAIAPVSILIKTAFVIFLIIIITHFLHKFFR